MKIDKTSVLYGAALVAAGAFALTAVAAAIGALPYGTAAILVPSTMGLCVSFAAMAESIEYKDLAARLGEIVEAHDADK